MSVKNSILEILLSAENQFVSGQELAEKLDVSRSYIWKSIKALEKDGYSIEAVSNRGYKINQSINILSKAQIQMKLNTNLYGKNLFVLDEVDSTNNYAKKLANAGEVSGTTVISDCQTGGKGRMGRSFHSPKGTGIYMSVIIRPEISLLSAQLITACVAVATAEAIEKVCPCDVKIKWVNDLFVNGKKIVGILTEASISFESNQLDYAIIGIGINIGSTSNFPEELQDIVTSLEDETGLKIDRNQLCSELLQSLETHILNIENTKFMDEYRKRSFIIGKSVLVSDRGSDTIGKAVAICDDASLKVEFENGEIRNVNSGEARIIKE